MHPTNQSQSFGLCVDIVRHEIREDIWIRRRKHEMQGKEADGGGPQPP